MRPRISVSRSVVLKSDYPQSVAKWLAGFQIILAFASMVFFVVAIVIGRTLGMLNVTVAIFFLVSGIVNLVSGRNSTPAVLVAVATSAVVAILAALVFLYRTSLGTVLQFRGFHIFHVYVMWEVLEGILMFLCLIEGIISIVFLLLACQSLCSCCVTQVIINPQDVPMDQQFLTTTDYANASGQSTSQRTNTSHITANYEIYLENRNQPPPDYKDVA